MSLPKATSARSAGGQQCPAKIRAPNTAALKSKEEQRLGVRAIEPAFHFASILRHIEAAKGERWETSNTGRVIAFTLQEAAPLRSAREAAGQRRQRPARQHRDSLEALVTLTHAISAPNIASLLILHGTRP